MNVIDKAARGKASNFDFDRFRLRNFIEELIDTDELAIREEPIDLADIAQALDGSKAAILFKAAGPEKQELVGNVVASRSRLARAFEVAPGQAAWRNPAPLASEARHGRDRPRRRASAGSRADGR